MLLVKIGFVYAGQGSQVVGMGKSFYDNYIEAKEVFDAINLDINVKKLCFEGPIEELSKTSNTQPCMVATAICATKLLKQNGVSPNYVCGLSLGEYSALQCAGVFDEQTAIGLVRFRGLAMENAVRGLSSKMVAILGLDRVQVQEVVDASKVESVVQIANYNCPGQIVIGGEANAVDRATIIAKEKGARRVVELNTSGPFHTSLLQPAAKALHEKCKEITFHKMEMPVIFNTTARELEQTATIAQMLERQVMSAVHFEDSIRYMVKQGVDTIIEIGPGKVLSGFVKKITKDVDLYQVEDKESLELTIERIIKKQ